VSTAADLLMIHAQPERRRDAAVEIVVPVYNEEAELEAAIRRLHVYLTERFPLPWLVTIADNASVDWTWGVACRLAADLDGVQALHLPEKGRGRALRAAWWASTAPVVAYMDVDLSTDLGALLPLVAPLLSGHSDVAIGTRLAPAARVVRGPKREMISRGYNLLLRATVHNGFSDAQCGFKALRADVARELLPLVEDEGWFFDTELLLLAEHNGLRIHEVPVDWVDDPDSRVDVVSTAKTDLRGLWRMICRLGTDRATLPVAEAPPAMPDGSFGGQMARFASIGLVSTVVFGLFYVVLRNPLGSVGAAVVALVSCAIANTAANRRLTFSLRGRAGRRRHYAAALALSLLPLALIVTALGVLAVLDATSLAVELVVLTAVNAIAALARFALLRAWVFAPARRAVEQDQR
jgi:putative flippase GtrA